MTQKMHNGQLPNRKDVSEYYVDSKIGISVVNLHVYCIHAPDREIQTMMYLPHFFQHKSIHNDSIFFYGFTGLWLKISAMLHAFLM